MIASLVNNNHEPWDQFLRQFAYALRTVVHETTGKTPAELCLGRKPITPFQKHVLVTDRSEFVVGNIEKLFKEVWRRENRSRLIRSQGFRSSESRERQLEQGEKKSLAGNKRGRREQQVCVCVSERERERENKRKRSSGLNESSIGRRQQQYKKARQDVMRCKRKVPSSQSLIGKKEKKERQSENNKRVLTSSSASTKQVKKRVKKTKENFGQVPAEDLRLGPEEGLLQSSRIKQGRSSFITSEAEEMSPGKPVLDI
ncbi:uncharacterized protein TNCV_2517011 [Trichonephila clavipes]|nr:uncharacterized protein TNCV_2517011 [Trichonephila clavipes]